MPSRNIVWFGIAIFALILGGFFGAWLLAREVDPVARETSGWSAARYIPETLTPSGVDVEETLMPGARSSGSSLPTFTFASHPVSSGANARDEELRAYLSSLGQDAAGEGVRKDFDLSGFFNFSFDDSLSITPQTSEQLGLREWANAAGASITALGDLAGKTNDALAVFFEHPSSETSSGVDDAAARLLDTAESIESIAMTPSTIAAEAAALATAYRAAADALKTVGEARTDEALLAAIIGYNERAAEISSTFVAVSDLLEEMDVHFEAGDAGTVFLFGS